MKTSLGSASLSMTPTKTMIDMAFFQVFDESEARLTNLVSFGARLELTLVDGPGKISLTRVVC